MTIRFVHHGDFSKTDRFLSRLKSHSLTSTLERFGSMGVEALRNATPKDTGETASSWGYRIVQGLDKVSIEWTNSNIVDGVNIAVIIQYGHGTRNGAYVEGIDYINPAIQPIFDRIAEEVWKEVRSV